MRLFVSLLFVAAGAMAACPDGFESYPELDADNEECIQVNMGHRYTWNEADQFCRAQGAHLVEIDSEEKFQFLKDQVAAMDWPENPVGPTPLGDFWTNLVDFGNPGAWIWMTSRVPYVYEAFMDNVDLAKTPSIYDAVILCRDTGADMGWRPMPHSHEALPICQTEKLETSSTARRRRSAHF